MEYSRRDYRAMLEERRRAERRKRNLIILLVVAIVLLGVVAFLFLNKPQNTGDTAVSGSDSESLAVSDANTSTVQSDTIVMTIKGDSKTRVLKGEEYLEAGCHAVDTQNKEILSDVATDGDVDTSKAGTYEVTYTAKTTDGRQNTAIREVVVEDSFASTTQYVPVCMYHYVYDDNNAPAELDNNWMHASVFEEELKYLSEHDYYYPSYEELVAFCEGKHTLPDRSIILTFDDAMPQFLDTGVALLDKYKIPATSFVICSDEDAKEKVLNHASQYVQYQSHTYNMHRGGSGVGKGGIIHASSFEEIVADQKKAAELLGENVAVAYPFGDNNETAQSALKDAGVKCAFTVENRQIKVGDNVFALPRVRVNGSFTLDTFVSQIS